MSSSSIEKSTVRNGADYFIDYTGGTIPIGDLPIGARVFDPSWEWEYRLGYNYSDTDWDGGTAPPGEVKPVIWIIVARNHYDLKESHVTLLAEGLIGHFSYHSIPNGDLVCEIDWKGNNHWGESGTGNAIRGLRSWLNSTGIHSGEGFYHVFSESFRSAIITTILPNREWQKGAPYNTRDKVFLPSTTELGDTEHECTYRIGEVYTFFSGAGDEERVAKMAGKGWHESMLKLWGESVMKDLGVFDKEWSYFTRSPSKNRCDKIRIFFIDLKFTDFSTIQGNIGVRPALNLKSDTLVSQVKC